MLRSRDDLRRDLRAEKLESLYLFFGAEDYLREQAARYLTDRALRGAALREFNESVFSLNNTDVQQALAAAEQLPMMAERRVVRITDINAKLREADEEALLHYVARPAPSSIVMFIADDLDKRRKLSKTLLDVCYAVEFAPLKDAELIMWAKGKLRELKAHADERTLAHLVGLVGANLRTLANELGKLATAALNDKGQITFETVDNLVARSRELSNFELSDHLIARNRPRALRTLQQLLDDDAEPLMLLGLIASNYHRLALAKELMRQGSTNDEVYRAVGLPYSMREEFLATARRADVAHLAQSIRRIAAADLGIKTSRATPRLQIEMLVLELTR